MIGRSPGFWYSCDANTELMAFYLTYGIPFGIGSSQDIEHKCIAVPRIKWSLCHFKPPNLHALAETDSTLPGTASTSHWLLARDEGQHPVDMYPFSLGRNVLPYDLYCINTLWL